MKPKYAPELDELLRVRDGSINESPHNIQMRNSEYMDNYNRRVDEFTRKGSQSSFNKNRRNTPRSRTFFGSLANELSSFVDEVKVEVKKEFDKKG